MLNSLTKPSLCQIGLISIELPQTHVCSPYCLRSLCGAVVQRGSVWLNHSELMWNFPTHLFWANYYTTEGTWNIKRIHDFGVVQSFRTWSNHCVKQWFDQVLQHYGPSTIHIGYRWIHTNFVPTFRVVCLCCTHSNHWEIMPAGQFYWSTVHYSSDYSSVVLVSIL